MDISPSGLLCMGAFMRCVCVCVNKCCTTPKWPGNVSVLISSSTELYVSPRADSPIGPS